MTDKTALYAPRGSAALLQRTSDPLEGYNRVVQDFNQGVENAVVHPAAQVWRALTPDFLRTGLSNFSDNLGYPLRVVNHLLQGDLSASWNDTKRFAANTTAGILGLWDPALVIVLPSRIALTIVASSEDRRSLGMFRGKSATLPAASRRVPGPRMGRLR